MKNAGWLSAREVEDGIKKWLETRQNQALYSDKSPCETIEELLNDVRISDTSNAFPWELLP